MKFDQIQEGKVRLVEAKQSYDFPLEKQHNNNVETK